jgi:predicted Zn-ribbon and HTH transcriptional regulator
MSDEREYSLEVIRRYREMEAGDRFNRRVMERVPISLKRDRVVLECGHEREFDAGFLDLRASVNLGAACPTCTEEWLKRVVEEEGE